MSQEMVGREPVLTAIETEESVTRVAVSAGESTLVSTEAHQSAQVTFQEATYDRDLAAFDQSSHPLLQTEAAGQIARLTAWLHHQAEVGEQQVGKEVGQYTTGLHHLSHRRAVAAILGLSVVGLWAVEHIPPLANIAALLLAGVNITRTAYALAPTLKHFWEHAGHPSSKILDETNAQIVQQAGGLGLDIVEPLLKKLILPTGAALVNPWLGLAVTIGFWIADKVATDGINAISGPLAKDLTAEEQKLEQPGALAAATSKLEVERQHQEMEQRSAVMAAIEASWADDGAQVQRLHSSLPGVEMARIQPANVTANILAANFADLTQAGRVGLERVLEAAQEEACQLVLLSGVSLGPSMQKQVAELASKHHLECRLLDTQAIEREIANNSLVSTSAPSQDSMLLDTLA